MHQNRPINVFERFNWFPFQHQCKHADELLKSQADQSANIELTEILSDPAEDFRCRRLTDKIERAWKDELRRGGVKSASLVRTLIAAFAFDWFNLALWTLLGRIALPISVLHFYRNFLVYSLALDEMLRLKQDNNATMPPVDALVASETDPESKLMAKNLPLAGIVLSMAAYLVSQPTISLEAARCGLKCRIALAGLIQRKSLRLHLYAQSTPKAASLVSNEVSSVEEAAEWILYLISGPLGILSAGVWLAVVQIGWTTTLIVAVAIIVGQLLLAFLLRLQTRFNRKRMELTNRRVDLTNALLGSIKVIKMFAWEPVFKQNIEAARIGEMRQIEIVACIVAMGTIVFQFVLRFLPALTQLILIEEDRLDVTMLFICAVLYAMFSVDAFLLFLKSLKTRDELIATCQRIKLYLLLEEFADQRQTISAIDKPKQLFCTAADIAIASNKHTELEPALQAHKHRQSQQEKPAQQPQSTPTNKPVISQLTMRMVEGDLVMLVGRVGAGKTTLLLSLLGETRLQSGFLAYTQGATFAYAPQEPWILATSVRDNILMGRKLEADRYKQVLAACSLMRDLSLFARGDATLVGPRGVTLSGGQRARVGLARAVYSHAHVYLLDDPLSAVDPPVAQHIFASCIRRLLASKLVVLATHQLQFMEEASKVVLLESGKQPLVGSGSEMMGREELREFSEGLEKLGKRSGVEGGEEALSCRSASVESSLAAGQAHEAQLSAHMLMLKLGFSGWMGCACLIFSLLYPSSNSINFYFLRIWSTAMLSRYQETGNDAQTYSRSLLDSWWIYLWTILAVTVSFYIFMTLIVGGVTRALRELHVRLIDSLVKAKASFYDSCQVGALTSRYAASFAIIDQSSIPLLMDLISVSLNLAGCCLAMGCLNPVYLIANAIFYPALAITANRFLQRSRKLAGLKESLLAPTLTNLSSMVDDLASIRSRDEYIAFATSSFEMAQDHYGSMSLVAATYEAQLYFLIQLSLSIWSGLVLTLGLVVLQADTDLPAAGTLVTTMTIATLMLPLIVKFGFLMETVMVNVENVRELTHLEPEEPAAASHQSSPERLEWRQGRITFANVSLAYSTKLANPKPVLNNLSFEICAGERVGIVGRTGAGKSSLISLLFRLYPFQGSICIDGVDISSLKLASLRHSLAVIPQDPILFPDSLRNNLDPLQAHSDEQLWAALELVGLREHVAINLPSSLHHKLSEGGRNLSVGQRQLVCLARAILKSPKVLLIDEATANVDPNTDATIQATIKSAFKGSTVLTIAHRLDTVLDYDRVMVLEAGEIVEFDRVERLLATEGGHFRALVQRNNESGSHEGPQGECKTSG